MAESGPIMTSVIQQGPVLSLQFVRRVWWPQAGWPAGRDLTAVACVLCHGGSNLLLLHFPSLNWYIIVQCSAKLNSLVMFVIAWCNIEHCCTVLYSVIQYVREWPNIDQCGTARASIEPSVCKKSVVAPGWVAGRDLTDVARGLCHGGSNLLVLQLLWLVACVNCSRKFLLTLVLLSVSCVNCSRKFH